MDRVNVWRNKRRSVTFAVPKYAIHIYILGTSQTVGRMVDKDSCIAELLYALAKEVTRFFVVRTEEILLVNDRVRNKGL